MSVDPEKVLLASLTDQLRTVCVDLASCSRGWRGVFLLFRCDSLIDGHARRWIRWELRVCGCVDRAAVDSIAEVCESWGVDTSLPEFDELQQFVTFAGVEDFD